MLELVALVGVPLGYVLLANTVPLGHDELIIADRDVILRYELHLAEIVEALKVIAYPDVMAFAFLQAQVVFLDQTLNLRLKADKVRLI